MPQWKAESNPRRFHLAFSNQQDLHHRRKPFKHFSKFSRSQRVELSRKVTVLIVKEAKQPQHCMQIIINEVPAENWIVNRLTLPELKAKLMAEKK
ncbi:hypothetical protein DRO35_05200 [Candidatus Bathyarchaeota archaeon]|nr:MAG: hypothetical protein DRO35_05200 [Candidatus Bathyarchaeota archaeon]